MSFYHVLSTKFSISSFVSARVGIPSGKTTEQAKHMVSKVHPALWICEEAIPPHFCHKICWPCNGRARASIHQGRFVAAKKDVPKRTHPMADVKHNCVHTCMNDTGVVMFLVPGHGKSCHRRCAHGSRYPHTHVYTQYVFSFLVVHIAYRTSTQVFIYTLAVHGS